MNRFVFYKTTIPTEVQDEDLLLDLEHLVRALRKDIMSYRQEDPATVPLPMVILNDSVLEESFGTLSLDELIEQVEDNYYTLVKVRKETGDTEETRVEHFLEDLIFSLHHKRMLLENGAGLRLRFHDMYQEMLKKIYLIRQEGGNSAEDEERLKFILELLAKWKKEHLLLGEYLPEQNIIVLYYEAIRRYMDTAKKLNRDLDFYTVLTEVLAREMYQTYSDSPQKKAISDLYAVHYLVKQQTEEAFEAAKYRYREWGDNLFNSWPYSKALLFLEENGDLGEFSKDPAYYESKVEKWCGKSITPLFAFEKLW